ncbi:adenosylcobinamide-GDP ribazoletransferase [Phenylobacterium sp.]|uniref:adenosylcobinamide-GDP ribazoletransferase n=1 Tax=Phenylobacterium sp. TaxID=1871053 RepID=UPI00301CFC2C
MLLVVAAQFLTRLPSPRLSAFEPDWVTRSARWFPLVGQLVGAMAGVVFLGAAQLWPPAVAAVLALAAGLLATGALHEDGLADTADGLFGGATPARRIEIMKDSRIGTYGVLALVVVLGLKAAGLAALTPVTGFWALVAVHGLGRAAAVTAMRVTPYAPEGRPTRWTPAQAGVRTWELAFSLVLAAWPLAMLGPAVAFAALFGAALGAAVVIATARRRLGGHTGDVLGAVEQAAEVCGLLGVVAVVTCA